MLISGPFQEVLLVGVHFRKSVLLAAPIVDSLGGGCPSTGVSILLCRSAVPVLSRGPRVGTLCNVGGGGTGTSRGVTGFFRLVGMLHTGGCSLVIGLASR